MLLLLAALACSDKDTDDSADTHTDSAVDDTGEDTGKDTGDTATGNDCSAPEIFGVVLGLNNTKESVEVPLECLLEVDAASITSVTLDGVETAWELDGQTVVADPSVLNNTGVLTATVTVDGQVVSTTFRAYTDQVELEQPAQVFDLGTEWTGGLTSAGVTKDGLMALSDDALVVFDAKGQVVAQVADGGTRGVCMHGRCFASPGYSRVYGGQGSEVIVTSIAEGTKTYSLKGDTVVDVGEDSNGDLQVVAQDTKGNLTRTNLTTGKAFSLGALTGDVYLHGDNLLQVTCKTNLVLTDLDPTSGKSLGSVETSLACSPDAVRPYEWDFDGDGVADHAMVLTYGDTETLVVRLGEGRGRYGGAQVVGSSSSITINGGDFVMTDSSRATFGSSVIVVEGKVSQENPVFVGQADAHQNVIHAKSGSSGGTTPMYLTRDRLLLVPSTETVMAERRGSSLTRTDNGDGISWGVDDVPVTVLDGAPVVGLFDEHVVSITVEDLVIDEREMSTGADWDFVEIVSPPDTSTVWVLAQAADGLELGVLDLDDPEGEAGQMRKIHPLGPRGGIREQQIKARPMRQASKAVPTGGTALDGFEGELVYDSLVVTMPWETGTACPCATVLLPGVSDDPDDLLAQAQVLSTSDQADCSDLATPLASIDAFDDGGWSVVMSDGTLLRLNEFQIPEKVVMEKDGDFYGRVVFAGDLNQDGLSDVILEGAEGHAVWLNSGDGGSLDDEPDLPVWLGGVEGRAAGKGLGHKGTYTYSFWIKPLG